MELFGISICATDVVLRSGPAQCHHTDAATLLFSPIVLQATVYTRPMESGI